MKFSTFVFGRVGQWFTATIAHLKHHENYGHVNWQSTVENGVVRTRRTIGVRFTWNFYSVIRDSRKFVRPEKNLSFLVSIPCGTASNESIANFPFYSNLIANILHLIQTGRYSRENCIQGYKKHWRGHGLGGKYCIFYCTSLYCSLLIVLLFFCFCFIERIWIELKIYYFFATLTLL